MNLTIGAAGTQPTGLNYFVDNANPPGQIFVTGANANGYSLRSLAFFTGGGGGGSIQASQPWTLYLYQYDTVSSNLTPIGSFQSQSFTFLEGDWCQFSGFSSPVGMQPNTHYAFSIHRNVQGWERLGSSTGDNYSPDVNCQAALIPVNGGVLPHNFLSSVSGYDANMDVGLDVISNIIVNAPIIAPGNVEATGTAVTLTSGTELGAASPIYQWQTDGGSGGALTNIPGATASTYTPPTSTLGVFQYRDYVGNGSGLFGTSSIVSLEITLPTGNATLTDIGAANPVPAPYDISQLISGNWSTTTGQGDGDGLNYYDNNSAGAGQTFTTGNNVGGYTLTSLAVKTTGDNSGIGNSIQYYLHIYTMNGLNATLLQDYTNTPLTSITASGDWVEWSGLNTHLNPNTQYAYSWQNVGGYTGNNNANGDPRTRQHDERHRTVCWRPDVPHPARGWSDLCRHQHGRCRSKRCV